MISEKSGYNEAFVWIRQPEETEPVVAGKVAGTGKSPPKSPPKLNGWQEYLIFVRSPGLEKKSRLS